MFKGTTIDDLMNMVVRAEAHAHKAEPRSNVGREPAHQMPVLIYQMTKANQSWVGVA